MTDGKYNRYKRTSEERAAIVSHSDRFGIRATSEKFGISVFAVKEIRKRHHKKLSGRIEPKRVRPKTKPVRRSEYANTDPHAVEKYRKTCLKHGFMKGLSAEEAQDFASFGVIQFMTTGPKNMAYCFADFNRDKFGATSKMTEENKDLLLALNKPEQFTVSLHDKAAEDEQIETLYPQSVDGMIAQLVYKYGFRQKEIGQMLGVHESEISVRLKKTIQEIGELNGREKKK
jgi:predicted XRE-type DNA-binding protein